MTTTNTTIGSVERPSAEEEREEKRERGRLEFELEAYVDRWGLPKVLRALETVCYGKAEHVDAQGDAGMSAEWLARGSALDANANQAESDGLAMIDR